MKNSEKKYTKTDVSKAIEQVDLMLHTLTYPSRFHSKEFNFRFNEYNYKLLPLLITGYITRTLDLCVSFRDERDCNIKFVANETIKGSPISSEGSYHAITKYLEELTNLNSLESPVFNINEISPYSGVYKYRINFNGSTYIFNEPILLVNIKSELYSQGEDLRIDIKISCGDDKIKDFYIPFY